MKKKTVTFLLSVMVLVLAGCGKEKKIDTTATEVAMQKAHSQEQTTDMDSMDESVMQSQSTEQLDSVISEPDTSSGTDTMGNEVSDLPENTPQSQPTEAVTQPSSVQKPEKSEPEEPLTQTPEPSKEIAPVSYSPQKVVELATEQTKAVGKIYLPDDLDRMLAEGTLSKEDYDACYPTDGAGYLEFYVATDMKEARDVSGTVKFNSEADIAANIAGMYRALPQQYFYIEYHGTAMYGSRECYVFYCYRA